MPDSAYNPAGAYSRIFSAGTGAADMVFGMHEKAQGIRHRNLQAQAAITAMQHDEESWPLQQKLLNEQVAAQTLNRLLTGIQASVATKRAARDLRELERIERLGSDFFHTEERGRDGEPLDDLPDVPAAGVKGLTPEIPKGEDEGIFGGNLVPAWTGKVAPQENEGGIFGGDDIPDWAIPKSATAPAAAAPQPAVSPYSENNVDRDQTPPFKEDGSAAVGGEGRSLEDAAAQLLAMGKGSAEDINMGLFADYPMPTIDPSKVAATASLPAGVTEGVAPTGGAAGKAAAAAVGTGSGEVPLPVSELGAGGDVAPSASDVPTTVTPAAAAAVATDAVPVRLRDGVPVINDSDVKMPKGLEWAAPMKADEILRDRLRRGSPSQRMLRKLEIAIADSGGVDAIRRLSPELAGRYAGALARYKLDSVSGRWNDALAQLESRNANRVEAGSLFRAYGMTPQSFPQEYAEMARGMKFDKDALATRVKGLLEREASGGAALGAMTRDPNVGPLASAARVLGANLSKEKSGTFQNAVAGFLAAGEVEPAKEAIKRAAIEASPPAMQANYVATLRMKEIAKQAAVAMGKFYLEEGTLSTGPYVGRIADIPLIKHGVSKRVLALKSEIEGLRGDYRQARSGASFSDKESAEYEGMFPLITKTKGENEAGLLGLERSTSGQAEATIRSVLGSFAPAVLGTPGGGSGTAAVVTPGARAVSGGTPGVPPFMSFQTQADLDKAVAAGAKPQVPFLLGGELQYPEGWVPPTKKKAK